MVGVHTRLLKYGSGAIDCGVAVQRISAAGTVGVKEPMRHVSNHPQHRLLTGQARVMPTSQSCLQAAAIMQIGNKQRATRCCSG